MSDHLRNTKTIHYTLMVVVLSVGAFCMSPQESQKYRAAQQDLEVLRNINVRGYFRYLRPKLKEVNSWYLGLLRSNLSGAPYSMHLYDRLKYRGVFFVSELNYKTLSGIRDYVDGSQQVYYFTLAKVEGEDVFLDYALGYPEGADSGTCIESGVGDALYKEIKCAPFNVQSDYVMSVGVVDVAKGEERKRIIPVEYPESPDNNWKLYFRVLNGQGEEINYLLDGAEPVDISSDGGVSFNLWFVGKYNEKGGSPYKMYPLQVIKNRLIDSYVWLAHSFPPEWILGSYGDTDFEGRFPALVKCWDEISKKSPEEALTYLKGEEESAKRPLDLLGVKIDGGYLFLVGPVFIFVLMVVLATTVKYALLSYKKEESWGEIASFSWFGLSQQLVPRAMIFVSIVVLPFSVSTFSVITDQRVLSYVHVIALGLCFLVFVPAIDIIRGLVKLRSMSVNAGVIESIEKKAVRIPFRKRIK
ncbi:hypothetical protein OH720_10230 [Pseudomonas sp. WJP1]|uniref:hypothetical protein n=1 Tax=Pseudomonas sp. WJP1 TaxID=2986947 RepID=UPI00234BEF9C|nr:hypothetical protein [Pseudomonas sp. WJP1]WCM53365.1 hypothetical protein OH720_10230 [Pseudomonas sp. WJP1]